MVKSMLRRAFFFGLRATGVPFAMRALLQRRRVTVLMYHDTDPDRLDRHLAALTKRYHFIGLEDLLAALRGDRFDDLPPHAAVLTFDDGHRGNAAILEVLERRKVPVTIFLCSGIVGTRRRFWFKEPLDRSIKRELKHETNAGRLERLAAFGFAQDREAEDRQALSAEEIERMRGLVDFQAHTIFHPILPACTDAEARAEIEDCRRQLERAFGLEIYALAYPNGDYSPRDVELTRSAGYACALTTEHAFVDGTTDLFRMPRVAINDDGGVSEAIVGASGLWGFLRPRLKAALGLPED
jgi:peptidoglycan/xylan/chitin deacetylase (PgdA/CDA1 family)